LVPKVARRSDMLDARESVDAVGALVPGPPSLGHRSMALEANSGPDEGRTFKDGILGGRPESERFVALLARRLMTAAALETPSSTLDMEVRRIVA